jgi:hypothetical protein
MHARRAETRLAALPAGDDQGGSSGASPHHGDSHPDARASDPGTCSNRVRTLLCLLLLAGLCQGYAHAQDSAAPGDLLLHLPLTDDLRDHSGHGHRVKVSGKVELRNGAAYFAGKEDWLELPHLGLNERPFAISMMIQVTGRHPIYGLIEQRDRNVPGRHLHVMLRGELQPHLGFYMNDALSPSSMARDLWTHLVFQYDGTHQQIWVGGRLLCQRAARPYLGTAGITAIGKSPRWSNVPARDFEGYMRQLRIFGRALSFDEIVALGRSGGLLTANTLAANESAAAPVPVSVPASAEIPFLAIEGNRLRIVGPAGTIMILEATANLLEPFEPLARLTNFTGRVEFVDTEAAQFPERFYRIVIP